MGMELTVDVAELTRRLKAPGKGITAGVAKGLREAARWGLREAKKRAPVKAGTLRRAIAANVTAPEKGLGLLELGIGVPGKGEPLVYARIQDIGGTVLPVKAQKLAIPVHPALLTKAGVGGIRAREVIEHPEEYGFTGIGWTSNAILGIRPSGGNGKTVVEVLFARASKVTIKGSRYLADTFAELKGGKAAELIAASIKAEVDGP